MSHPNDTPAAAWYPDPQTPGQVRWWDGTNWTEHVSTPTSTPTPTPTPTVAAVGYIGRHAAGATPAPRRPSTAPRIRPRVRIEVPVEAHAEPVPSLSYA